MLRSYSTSIWSLQLVNTCLKQVYCIILAFQIAMLLPPELHHTQCDAFVTPSSTFPPSNLQRQCNLHNYRFQAVHINHESIFNELDNIYTNASRSIKCPFFRRRAADFIDNVAMVLKFLIVRHKSILNDIPLELLEVPGCKAMGKRNPDGSVFKKRHLQLEEIRIIIESDWCIESNKGYYITGRLNSTIYRDDCLFSGPDPDMPVRGLRKYLAASSHLFEAKNSFAKLHKVKIVNDDGGEFGYGVIEAQWQLEGVLMLPWRPKVKPWSGWTRYHLDEDNLIGYHEEGWDISVMEAFIGTMFPEIGEKIWEREVEVI